MKVNLATIELIKEFEGFEPVAYLDPAGILTIGYGTTAAAGVGIVPRKGMRISERDAEGYLEAAVAKFAGEVEDALKAHPTPNQFGAMVSLAYNIGPGAFRGSSVLRLFNAGDVQGAANAFLMWNKATVNGKKVVLNGLTRRREAERALFLSMNATKPQPAPPKSPTASTSAKTPAWLAGIVDFFVIIFGRK